MKKLLPLSLLSSIVISTASADLYLYEGFDYTESSSLSGANGGSGWNSSWLQETAGNDLIVSANADNLAGNLVHTGLRVGKTGGGGGTGTLYSRTFDSIAFSDSDVLWFFYGYNANDSGFDNGFELWSGGQEVLFVGNDPTKTSPDRNQISVRDDSNDRTQSTTALQSNGSSTQGYMVGKITFGASNETLDLYYGTFFPVGEGGLATNMGTVFTGVAIDNIASIDQVKVDINNSGQGFIDEIRFGSTFEDVRSGVVVPEPSAYAFIVGTLALGMIMMRRRR